MDYKRGSVCGGFCDRTSLISQLAFTIKKPLMMDVTDQKNPLTEDLSETLATVLNDFSFLG